MGHPPLLKIALGSVLVGGMATAQQGIIVDPWRVAPPPTPASLVPPSAPASGLPGPAAVAAPVPAPALAPAPAPVKWSPPVVELLVDPWARAAVVAPAPRPSWVPQTVEVIDPWAELAREPAPARVAGRPASPPQPIF